MGQVTLGARPEAHLVELSNERGETLTLTPTEAVAVMANLPNLIKLARGEAALQGELPDEPPLRHMLHALRTAGWLVQAEPDAGSVLAVQTGSVTHIVEGPHAEVVRTAFALSTGIYRNAPITPASPQALPPPLKPPKKKRPS